MAGHQYLRVYLINHCKALQPGPCKTHRDESQNAVNVNHVTREHDVLLRQPDHHIARGVSAATVFEFDHHAAQRQAGVIALHKSVGKGWYRSIQPFLEHLEGLQVASSASFHVGFGAGVSHDLRPLCPEIAISQPAMILPTGVDHPPDRLRRDFFDGFLDLARRLEGSSAVDQYRPLRGDHQTDIGVQPFVFVSAPVRFADVGIHAIHDRTESYLDSENGKGDQCTQNAYGTCCHQGFHRLSPFILMPVYFVLITRHFPPHIQDLNATDLFLINKPPKRAAAA